MRQQTKSISDEEIISEMRNIMKNLNKNYLTQEDVNTQSEKISASTIINRFGSWKTGLAKADLKISVMCRRKYSNDEMFENMLNVWTYYGRQPKYDEMKKSPSKISPKIYEKRFGSWRKALEAFVHKVNSGEDLDENTSEINTGSITTKKNIEINSIKKEEKREIGLGLRYKVLNRDNFKCVKCGASPATDYSCKLHIDHIIPFSQDGKTIFDNLQTLCEKCNLGKGDRFFF